MRRDIDFRSEGVVCRGWFYTPEDGSRRHPTVVMAHGFSAVKEQRLDRFAKAFAGAGLATLVFDYRGLGASDGTPRQDIDPHAQVVDYRNALSFARALPEVDPERIGVWGTSYSGAHVLSVGAVDRRVKAVVSQVPLLDAWPTFEQLAGREMLLQVAAQLVGERERVYGGGKPTMIPAAGKEGELAVMTTPDAREWFFLTAKSAPNWRNEVTLLSLERLLEYSPIRFIDRIAPIPLLLVAAEKDFLPLEIARKAFERAGEPKRLCMLPVGHFEPYEEPAFATASKEAIDWFRKWL